MRVVNTTPKHDSITDRVEGALAYRFAYIISVLTPAIKQDYVTKLYHKEYKHWCKREFELKEYTLELIVSGQPVSYRVAQDRCYIPVEDAVELCEWIHSRYGSEQLLLFLCGAQCEYDTDRCLEQYEYAADIDGVFWTPSNVLEVCIQLQCKIPAWYIDKHIDTTQGCSMQWDFSRSLHCDDDRLLQQAVELGLVEGKLQSHPSIDKRV